MFLSQTRWLRPVQLVGSCVVLGVGVGLVLTAGLGSDGYSSLVNGVSRASGLAYAPVNWSIGFALVLFAWLRGVTPGPGTLVHPLVVGSTVDGALEVLSTPGSLALRAALLAVGAVLLAVGVAGYLETGLGAGPVEAAASAGHPVPFRIAYSLCQAGGALAGWVLGADLGVGTLVIVFGVGPIVTAIRNRLTPTTTVAALVLDDASHGPRA
jgi:uncharacterized membrane protein YczE